MKIRAVILFILFFLCSISVPSAFAQQTLSPTPTQTGEVPTQENNILSKFISDFDWLSGGLIFYTPSLLDTTIKLQDGTELSGVSSFRTIFYDIAIPLFVLITSFVAFSHISNDNTMQLTQFLKRLVVILALFIITPAILTYSIQFVNLLNEKIMGTNAYNITKLVNTFLENLTQIPLFRQQFSIATFIPNWDTVMQLIIFIISIGFLLIGFIYIIFQAVIRFIALLLLSVIFPIVLPFALSEKTENIANTYFRTWFSFLIQQPAFVLGFAIVSSILTSISQAHNASIGTLFVYSGSLIFLGGINVFIGRIFGDGWSLMTTSAQSMIMARNFNKGAGGIIKKENITRVPAYASKAIGHTKKIVHKAKNLSNTPPKTGEKDNPQATRQKLEILKKELYSQQSNTSSKRPSTTAKNEATNKTHSTTPHSPQNEITLLQDGKRNIPNIKRQETHMPMNKIPSRQSRVVTRRESTIKPITTKRTATRTDDIRKDGPQRNTIPRRRRAL